MKGAVQFDIRDKCPLCDSGDLGDYLLLDGLRIANCRACEFIFVRDILPASEMAQFYTDTYHSQRHIDGQRVNATININVLRSFCPHLSGRSLLDIGSGYGFLLDKARGQGLVRVAGVELSQAERDYSVEKLGLQVFSQMDEFSADDQFDIVTAFEVLEHIPEPRDFIRRAYAQLKSGGSLIIGTDNFKSSVVHTLGSQFPKWIPHEHISYFTGETLRQILEMNGMLTFVACCSYTPWELHLRQLIFRASLGRRGGKTYCYQTENAPDNHKGFRFFPFRLMFNRFWFSLTKRTDLKGEMMFIHMIKK